MFMDLMISETEKRAIQDRHGGRRINHHQRMRRRARIHNRAPMVPTPRFV